MNSIAAFAPWVGSACCCLAFFVLLIVISAFLFRSRKPTPDEIDGLPAAPGSGVQTRASLTQLEYGPTQRTPRPAPIPSPSVGSAARKSVPPTPPVAPSPPFRPAPSNLPSNDPEDEGAMTSVMDRGRQPDLPPPPPPPPGTITLSPSSSPQVRSRMFDPKPTIAPGPDGLPPPLPKPEE